MISYCTAVAPSFASGKGAAEVEIGEIGEIGLEELVEEAAEVG